jgi:hypothetical protein
MSNPCVQRRHAAARDVAGLSHDVRSLLARSQTKSRHLKSAATKAAATGDGSA